MAIGWVDAVRSLWVQDEPIDFPALEKKWLLKPFETGGGALVDDGQIGPTTKLLCCLSGFEDREYTHPYSPCHPSDPALTSVFHLSDEERSQIVDTIKTNGGNYTGSLDRTVTHLIVYEPAGKKYMAAKRWGTHVVALPWVRDTIERGMILDEAFYDPLLPKDDIGKGAWTRRELRPRSRTKRQRDPAANVHNARRKLRKTASMKLNSQRDNMWGEILGQQPSADRAASYRTGEPTQPPANDSMLRPTSESVPYLSNITHPLTSPGTSEDSLFTSCHFSIFNFQSDQVAVLAEYISSRGGKISQDPSLNMSQGAAARQFIIVPQTFKPCSHPPVPDGVEIVTEFFIERCVHGKRLLSPQDHVFGRPFPVFPIEGFHELSISTSGFVDLDLNQVERTVRQIGARYEERFNRQCTMLICDSLASVRKAKLDLAVIWNVPVLKSEWLWQCVSQGKKLAINDFLFPELEAKRIATARTKHLKPLQKSRSVSDMRRDMDTSRLSGRRAHSTRISLPGRDMTAFDTNPLVATEPPAPEPGHCQHSESRHESGSIAEFDTAQTHQTDQETQVLLQPEPSKVFDVLTEKSASDLNKVFVTPQLPPEDREPLTRVRSEVCDSEAGDYGGSASLSDGEDTAVTEKHRLERERGERDAAERRALSHKLTSLLESTGDMTGNDGVENRSANTGSSARHRELPAALPLPRRKRNIMGRAVSNVSAASTESQDSCSAGRAMSRTHSAVICRDDSPSEEEPEAKAPTTTQLQYDDPEATISKARLMSKMLGRSSIGTGGSHKSTTEDRVTMGGVWLQQQNGPGDRPAGGRSMRRRQA